MRPVFFLLVSSLVFGQGTQPLTVQDMMKFRQIEEPIISEDGSWAGYIGQPDRGDSEAVLRGIEGGETYTVANGLSVAVAYGGAWAAVVVGPDTKTREAMDKKALEKHQNDLVLVDTSDGKQTHFARVKDHAFSKNGDWLAILFHPEKVEPENGKAGDTDKKTKSKADEKEADEKEADEKEADEAEDDQPGGTLLLRKLISGHEIEIPHVVRFALSGSGGFVVYATVTPDDKDNGLFYRHLAGDHSAQVALAQAEAALYPQLAWDKADQALAWLQGNRSDPTPRPNQLRVWTTKNNKTSEVGPLDTGIFIPAFQELRWSRDGERLFFGTRPRLEARPKAEESPDLYDVDQLLTKVGLDVWHGKDPLIKPNERKFWEKHGKKKTLTAVYHLNSRKMVQLATEQVPWIQPGEQEQYLLGYTDGPYRRATTWAESKADFYLVNLKTGEQTLAARGINHELGSEEGSISLSPEGRHLVWFEDGQYVHYNVRTQRSRVLTAALGVPFANEDHDYPGPPPGYGLAGWLENDDAVLLYDKYDIWSLPMGNGRSKQITAGDGRRRQVTYRLVEADEERRFYRMGEKVLLRAFYEREKNYGFYHAEIGASYLDKRLEDLKCYRFVAKAKRADVMLYTREDFREFPDLWASDTGLNLPKRISTENPQLGEFALGEPALINWRSLDGKPQQGVLFKPGNYQEGKRYPVLVYYYRIFSNRMYQFNKMEINHRPNFPFYTSNGYAVFLPDIHFKVGTPGASATRSLVPGVQKLIEMGIADPDAIGLHGHSWSGYQTAFVITETDIFKAAVAGAPVANMTSAYSGIRLGSGRARQFQYEVGQSRIGANMWQRRDLYIENSPVFFADRINTPLLIQFGDKDEAVPWQQGIELYLALRRLDKDVVFLQYHDEPHHLKKYPNKLDYTLKMKAFFDHYLMGKPAPKWLTEGVPYQGD